MSNNNNTEPTVKMVRVIEVGSQTLLGSMGKKTETQTHTLTNAKWTALQDIKAKGTIKVPSDRDVKGKFIPVTRWTISKSVLTISATASRKLKDIELGQILKTVKELVTASAKNKVLEKEFIQKVKTTEETLKAKREAEQARVEQDMKETFDRIVEERKKETSKPMTKKEQKNIKKALKKKVNKSNRKTNELTLQDVVKVLDGCLDLGLDKNPAHMLPRVKEKLKAINESSSAKNVLLQYLETQSGRLAKVKAIGILGFILRYTVHTNGEFIFPNIQDNDLGNNFHDIMLLSEAVAASILNQLPYTKKIEIEKAERDNVLQKQLVPETIVFPIIGITSTPKEVATIGGFSFINDLEKRMLASTKKVAVKYGSERTSVSGSCAQVTNLLGHKKSARILSMSSKEIFGTYKYSKGMIKAQQRLTSAYTLNAFMKEQEDLLTGTVEYLGHKAIVSSWFFDRTGRMYDKANKIVALATQGNAKGLYKLEKALHLDSNGMLSIETVMGQLILKKGKLKEAMAVIDKKNDWNAVYRAVIATIGKKPSIESVKEFYSIDNGDMDKHLINIGHNLTGLSEDVLSGLRYKESSDVLKRNLENVADVNNKLSKWIKERHYLVKMIQAHKNGRAGIKSDFILLKDSAAGCMIWWSLLLGLPKMARIANIFEANPDGSFEDPYIYIVTEFFKLSGKTADKNTLVKMREQIKETLQAILHGGTFYTAAIAINALELGLNLNADLLKEMFVGIFGESVLLIEATTTWVGQSIATPTHPAQKWFTPDNFPAQTMANGPKTRSNKRALKHQNKKLTGEFVLERKLPYMEDTKGNPIKGSETIESKRAGATGKDVKYGYAKIRAWGADFLHSIDAFVARFVIKALQGNLAIFVHDHFGCHANFMYKVEKASIRAAKKLNRGAKQQDGSYLPWIHQAVNEIVEQTNSRRKDLQDRVTLAEKEGRDCNIFLSEKEREVATIPFTILRLLKSIKPLDETEIGTCTHFLQP